MKPPELPSYVDVGVYRYSIEQDDAAILFARNEARTSALTGWSDHRTQRIVLDPGLGRDAIAETLVHEVVHALLSQFPTGIEGDAAEAVEEGITLALGFGLVDVIRRNPDLIAYVVDTSHHDDTTTT